MVNNWQNLKNLIVYGKMRRFDTMFSEHQRDFIKNYRTKKQQAENAGDSTAFNTMDQTNSRIRQKIRTCITDLTLYAECMPDKQLKQVFTYDTLLPLFDALSRGKESDGRKDNKVWNQRVFDICYTMEETGLLGAYAQLNTDIKRLFENVDKHGWVVPVRSIGWWESEALKE